MTAALAVVLLAAAPVRPLVFSAPAGDRLAGAPNAGRPYDAILPNGRTVSPVGDSVITGKQTMGLAVSPNGRYAIVADDSDGRYALVVVDTTTFTVIGSNGVNGAASVVALHDPADPAQTLVIATGGARSDDVTFFTQTDDGVLTPAGTVHAPSGPGAIAVSPDGRTAYVVSARANMLSSIDVTARRLISSVPVGFFPAGVAASASGVLVSNEGLMAYSAGANADRSTPLFAVPPVDTLRASSLFAFSTGSAGIDAANLQSVKMDQPVDEVTNAGGAHPGAMVLSKDGRFAFVCMVNVDRIAVVALTGVPRVVGGLSLRLFQSSPIGSAPYGMQPTAIAHSADGTRLYVTLAGINAVAVIDSAKPVALRRLGLIPSGWYPDAVAVSPDNTSLFIGNALGTLDASGAQTATLQRVDLHTLPLSSVTLSALRYNRTLAYGKESALVPQLRIVGSHRSSAIQHVVLILDGNAMIDASTPNAASLAHTYGSAQNFYADADTREALVQYELAGTSTPFAMLGYGTEMPEAYPRNGYIFNALERAGRTYRGYGTLTDPVQLAPATLASHADIDYPNLASRATDADRAAAFVRDMDPLVRTDTVPDFTAIRLPRGDAGTDVALGSIIGYLQRSPQWHSTAVFILADRTVSGAGYGSYAIVVSPYAKHGYVGHKHLSTASVVKTEEELLGLPPLSLNDLLATDMADFFTPHVESDGR